MRGCRGQLDDVWPCTETAFATSQGRSCGCLARDFSQVLSIAAATALMAIPEMASNQVIVLAPPPACPFSHCPDLRPWTWITKKRRMANATANISFQLLQKVCAPHTSFLLFALIEGGTRTLHGGVPGHADLPCMLRETQSHSGWSLPSATYPSTQEEMGFGRCLIPCR